MHLMKGKIDPPKNFLTQKLLNIQMSNMSLKPVDNNDATLSQADAKSKPYSLKSK